MEYALAGALIVLIFAMPMLVIIAILGASAWLLSKLFKLHK